MNPSHPHSSEKEREIVDFVSYAERLGYRNPMYLSKDLKTAISKAYNLHKDILAQSHLSAEAAEKRAVSIERAVADYTDRLPELVQDLALCIINQVKDTNSTITTIELDGVTFRGEPLGDWKLVITKRTALNPPKEEDV